MDRAHTELLGPLKSEELRREARHAALADLVPHAARPNRASMLAIWLGRLLIETGCRIDAAGRRHAPGGPLAFLPSPCSHET
jgi:hypothetical protein